MKRHPSRRQWLTAAGVGTALFAVPPRQAAAEEKPKERFRYCLNTATIRGQNLNALQEVEIAERAGYDAIEPWLDKLQQYERDGKSIKDLGKRIKDKGLTVEDAIAFPSWIVDDEARRKRAFEEVRRAMDLLQQLGGKRIAAPPAGATEQTNLSLVKVAERYRELCELGDQMGIVPIMEVWGFSKSIGRLSEAAFVAIESGHRKACVLPDVFHLYKGGSGYNGLRELSANALPVIHVNDYPAQPPRAEIKDSARVYPGDGVAPLKQMIRDLRDIGFRGVLSLELFNPTYYKQDALEVAVTGLKKTTAVVESSREE